MLALRYWVLNRSVPLEVLEAPVLGDLDVLSLALAKLGVLGRGFLGFRFFLRDVDSDLGSNLMLGLAADRPSLGSSSGGLPLGGLGGSMGG